MVDSETIDTKVSDKKEEFNDEQEEEINDNHEETKEKRKNLGDGVINDLYASIDEFKEYIKNMQKNADRKYAEYKKSTVQTIDIDLKSGKCVKTVRFENSLDLENITAKFTNGIVLINIPKLIIPKHKINVE